MTKKNCVNLNNISGVKDTDHISELQFNVCTYLTIVPMLVDLSDVQFQSITSL